MPLKPLRIASNRDHIRAVNKHVADMLRKGRKCYGTMYAILWCADEAIAMSENGDGPDEFLTNTLEETECRRLLAVITEKLEAD